VKEKIESIKCEANFDLAEDLFEGHCSINDKKIKVLVRAIRKLGKIVKINEIIKVELEALEKLEAQERDLNRMSGILKK